MRFAVLLLLAPFVHAENCAIPLKRMAPGNVPKMPIYKAESSDKMVVPLPMPECAEQAKVPVASLKLSPDILRNPNWKINPFQLPKTKLEAPATP